MSEETVKAELTEIFREVFMRDDLVLEPSYTAADVPGWDSFKHIEIIMAVEEKFGIKVSTRDLDGLKSVADLLALIQAKAPGR